MIRPLRALALGALLSLAGCAGLPDPDGWERVHSAVHYRRWSPHEGSVVHAVRVDLRHRDIAIALTPQREAGRTIDRFGGHAASLAAINASFFGKAFEPRGATRSDGSDWSNQTTPEAFPLLACGERDCAILTDPAAFADARWRLLVAGIPALLRAGAPAWEPLCAPRRAFCDNPHPRTAIGLDAARQTLWIVAAEGRHEGAAGLSVAQTAMLLRELGATDAINLDGGGSTTLSTRGRQRMRRPDNEHELRVIGNALLVRERGLAAQ